MVHTEHTTENSRWDLNMGVWSAVTESLREENGTSKFQYTAYRLVSLYLVCCYTARASIATRKP